MPGPWSAVEDECGQLTTVVPDSGAITAALLLINLS